MKIFIILLVLTSCRIITEYDNTEVLEIRVLKSGECNINVLGVQVKNDTTFNLPVLEASRFIYGNATTANITIYGSGDDSFKLDVKGYINLVYFRKD